MGLNVPPTNKGGIENTNKGKSDKRIFGRDVWRLFSLIWNEIHHLAKDAEKEDRLRMMFWGTCFFFLFFCGVCCDLL